MQLEDIKLGIVGLGYVGLPLCVEFAKEMPVVAYDINPERPALRMNKSISKLLG